MQNPKQIRNEPGSFKDPSGGIFYYRNKVYRSVSMDTDQFYRNLVESPFFQNLIRTKYFIPTWPVDLSQDSNISKKFCNKTIFFEHKYINMLSFPYEWTAAMLLDAATHTLDLQALLLQKNLSLKDATPYNIQFFHTQPIFIDLCSMEKASTNGIWIAYNQFCQTFLYPLLLFQYGVSKLNTLYLSNMDGLTLDETVQAIGFRPALKYGLIIDYLIPALLTKLKHFKIFDATKKTVSTSYKLDNSTNIQLHNIRRLKKCLTKIRSKKRDSDWVRYPDKCTYSDERYAIKMQFIEGFFISHQVKSVLDLGCNLGDFSIIAAKHNCKTVALDSDHACVNYLYEISKEKNYSILPLCLDIANPSPSIGWFNKERDSFLNRINHKFDCLLALALIHHLMITNRIPMPELPNLFAHCTSRFMIVEYIGFFDKMVQDLMRYRNESYEEWHRDIFEKNMISKFNIISQKDISNSEQGMDRCLYLMEKK